MFSTNRKNDQIGVEFLPTGVAVVKVKSDSGQISAVDFLPSTPGEEQQLNLRNWVNQNRLQKVPCVCLIADTDCNVNQIEKPDVDDAELIPALTWRIKDLISYEVESAIVEIYPMPLSSKNNTQQVSVVSAQDSIVRDYVDSIQSSGLELIAIDIHDLVRKNLKGVKQARNRSLAVLNLGGNCGELSIFQDTDLYVSRSFKIGISQVEQADSNDLSIYDSLLLEIQRSMDYYESYYGLGSVANLEIFPRIAATEKMALYLQNLTSFDIDFVAFDETENQIEIPHQCFHAYCAALRGIQL